MHVIAHVIPVHVAEQTGLIALYSNTYISLLYQCACAVFQNFAHYLSVIKAVARVIILICEVHNYLSH